MIELQCNPDWNYSAPHGAGRLFSRGKAKENFKLEDYGDHEGHLYNISIREYP